jgi:3-oxoacyl-[acyl-carrier-protein] synthase-3
MTQVMPYARIVGSGGFLPPRVVSNDNLAADLATRQIETSDQWITERTGIRQRHLADKGMTTSALATEAARRALLDAEVQASELDLIIVATSTPDFVFPSTACLVQANIGNKGAAAFDVQAVCSGFVYGLTTADSFMRAGRARCVVHAPRARALCQHPTQRPPRSLLLLGLLLLYPRPAAPSLHDYESSSSPTSPQRTPYLDAR